MTKTAWVFPGQGSQKVGMGSDLDQNETAKSKLAQAQDILGWSVSAVSQSEDKLVHTLYTQPSLYVIEAILADSLLAQGQTPDLVAGHSLGEYVALYTAGVFDFATGLRLVKRRAELMETAAGGKMVALIKFEREQLQTAIDNTADVVMANDNSEMQAVISGTPAAVDQVISQVKSKRAIPLNVSGAFHSPLMADAAREFQGVLQKVTFADAQVPVLSNVDPTPTVQGETLKQRLIEQMTGSVRWREIMIQLSTAGVSRLVEVGPGNVLTGLMKRTNKEVELENVNHLVG